MADLLHCGRDRVKCLWGRLCHHVGWGQPLHPIYPRCNDVNMTGQSTSYAEFLRIKRIVDACDRDRPMLFLIDELFRGTNSRDLRDATFAVLRSLVKPGAFGLAATHDTEIVSHRRLNPASVPGRWKTTPRSRFSVSSGRTRRDPPAPHQGR